MPLHNRTPLLAVSFALGLGLVAIAFWMRAQRVDASARHGTIAETPRELAHAPDAPTSTRADAHADERARLDALDAADPALPFDQKYAGCDPHLLALARERVAARLESDSTQVFDALFAAGTTQKKRVQPGEDVELESGSIVRRSRKPWQPYGIAEIEYAEFDRAEQPETKRTWAELTWLDRRLEGG